MSRDARDHGGTERGNMAQSQSSIHDELSLGVLDASNDPLSLVVEQQYWSLYNSSTEKRSYRESYTTPRSIKVIAKPNQLHERLGDACWASKKEGQNLSVSAPCPERWNIAAWLFTLYAGVRGSTPSTAQVMEGLKCFDATSVHTFISGEQARLERGWSRSHRSLRAVAN